MPNYQKKTRKFSYWYAVSTSRARGRRPVLSTPILKKTPAAPPAANHETATLL